jgi:DNA-binding NarL/FixJ family response regulator
VTAQAAKEQFPTGGGMEKKAAQGARVLLVDDHPTMRTGLSMLLARVGYTICGEAENQKELLACIDSSEADVVLLDLSLSGESGLDLLDALRRRSVATLVYSMHEDWNIIELAFERGAQGYVTKREGPGVLLEGLERVVAGGRYISPRASHGLASRVLIDNAEGRSALSSREKQVMDMLARGETNKDIAEKLYISTHTVQTYYARLIEKLGLTGMKDLRKTAIQRKK